MSSTKIIRSQYGFTQEQLAVYLDISVSLLRMAEAGKRILPTQALLKLNGLYAHLQQAPAHAKHKAIAPHIQKHAAQHTKQMQAQHKELLYQTALHKKKMDAMQKQHAQALQALALVHTLQQKSSKQAANNKDNAWLQHIETLAGIALKNTHPMLQACAQIKMDMLQQEAAAIEQVLTIEGTRW
jgi:transcriptional regulator with XRE-family HTH domain